MKFSKVSLHLFLITTLAFLYPANSTAAPSTSPTIAAPKLITAPKGSTPPNYEISFNKSGKTTIDIWEDFQCANCARFHTINGDFLSKVVNEGKIKVNFHVLSFLGADSVVLANAAACAADEGKFLQAHAQLFKLQAESKNSGIWTNEFLLTKMTEVGIGSAKFNKCIEAKKYFKWVSAVQKSATNSRILATPTVLINGKPINRATDYYNSAAFESVVADPSSILSPSPIPTPSPFKLNFPISKTFGTEPVIGKPTGTPPTNLGIGDLIVGMGNQIQSNEKITVQYVLMDWESGKILESSWSSAPFTSSLSNLIPGWQRGLIGMKVGGRRILIVPPDLAYGEKGSGSVGPNRTLIFVIDLLAVTK